jgi:hypothetical protein
MDHGESPLFPEDLNPGGEPGMWNPFDGIPHFFLGSRH